MAKSVSRSPTARHIRIPHVVMRSEDYTSLSGNAVKFLNALVFQYNGKNNGDLTAAFSVMQKQHGFRSKATLSRALNELLKAGLIIRTRTSLFQKPNNLCALYALTWHAIDECPGKKLEVKPTIRPWRQFSMEKQNTRFRNCTLPDPETVPGKNPPTQKLNQANSLPTQK